MIQVEHLTKKFESLTAVDQVSFALEKGQTLALVGTSGCGKTTTLKMINRLIEPTSGMITVDGKNVLELRPEQLRREMGYVIQDIGLFPHYTVEQNVAVLPRLLKWPVERIRERVSKLMKQLVLPYKEYAAKYPHQLSGGQQQRVGIARALAADPPIILMDEPFGALDPITRREIRKDFMELDELSSKTTIMVTHDIEEAFEMGDLICLLDKGKIQQLGTPKQLLYQPANDFVRQFLKGKTLDLELDILEIKDIFSFLPESSIPNEAITLAPSTSIKNAMSSLADTDRGIGKVRWNEQEKAVDLRGLMEAFQLSKN